MDVWIPGRASSEKDLKPGDLFWVLEQDRTRHLAMKIHDKERGSDAYIRFLHREEQRNPTVLLSGNRNFTVGKTVLLHNDPKAYIFDREDFVGTAEVTADDDLAAAWLGVTASNEAILTINVQNPHPPPRFGFVSLKSGEFFDEWIEAVWFKKWRMIASEALGEEPYVLFDTA